MRSGGVPIGYSHALTNEERKKLYPAAFSLFPLLNSSAGKGMQQLSYATTILWFTERYYEHGRVYNWLRSAKRLYVQIPKGKQVRA